MASDPSSGHSTNFYRFVRRWLTNPLGHLHHLRRSTSGISTYPRIIPRCPSSSAQDRDRLRHETMILDIEGGLLRSSSTFPHFMLIAMEAGGFLRGFILLCVYLVLCCLPLLLPEEVKLKVMVMVCFFGLKEKKVARVARATLPKHFLEDVGMEGLEAVRGVQSVVGVSRVIPRVMVKPFLEDYLGVDVVVGREVNMVRGFHVDLLENMSEGRLELVDLEGAEMVGFGSSSSYSGHDHHHLFSWCKRKGKDAAVMLEMIWFDDEVAFDFPMGICGTKASCLKLLLHASIWKPS